MPGRLIGRTAELAVIEGLLAGVRDRGRALLVRGEAGIGKSSLLRTAVILAERQGFQVLRTTCVQAESHLPFAGLHQLLQPELGRIDALPPPQRSALRAVFGLTDAPAPPFFLIALAVLDLLADVAGPVPLLLVVEDGQWLDRSTLDVLMFVARRLDSEPVIMLGALRSGPVEESSGFAELVLGPLDEEVAQQVLDEAAPDLVPELRRRVLAAAEGNPLALVELPAAFSAAPTGGEVRGTGVGPDVLPLTARLEKAFAERFSELSGAARAILLAAVIDNGVGSLAEIVAVAGRISGDDIGPDTLAAAVATGLIEENGQHIRFRHPLMRSAIYHVADVARRREMHLAWAEVLSEDPDRRVWHRAAAAIRADEDIALALEEVAARARRRGAMTVAIAALERAAQLTVGPVAQGARLVSAAELAFEMGRRDLVLEFLQEAGQFQLGPRELARIASLHSVFDDDLYSGVAGIRRLQGLAEEAAGAGDTQLALELLLGAANRCWWTDPGQETRRALIAAVEYLEVRPQDTRRIAILALTDPVRYGPEVAELLAEDEPAGGEVTTLPGRTCDPGELLTRGLSAYAIGDSVQAEELLVQAIAGLRAQGLLALLAQALVLRSACAFHRGTWTLARPEIAEAIRLSADTNQVVWGLTARILDAELAAVRDESVSPRADGASGPAPASRGIIALLEGRPDDLVDDLLQVAQSEDLAYRFVHGRNKLGFMAEAAVLSARPADGRAVLASFEVVAARTPAPALHLELAFARAVLAEDDQAEALFAVALADPRLPDWPWPRARLLLGYGTWLRRHRRILESREPLREARDLLDEIGAVPWSRRARQELSAAGEASHDHAPRAADRLSPQEFQIAQMVAEGLSNREIGQRLYLSHRTVASHLYRIFPKLDITSRHQLRAVLGADSRSGTEPANDRS